MKRIIIILLINSLMIQLSACYTPQLVSKDDITQTIDNPGLIIKTNDQVEYAFDRKSYIVTEDSILGIGSIIFENGAKIDPDIRSIALADVESVKQEEIDGVKTSIAAVAGVGLGVLIVLGLQSIMEDATSNIAQGVGQAINNIYPKN